MAKRKKRIKIPVALRSQLQKEVHSECPFCSDDEVGCFEVHHIDEDTLNNNVGNLLLLCSTCHTKITKKVISLKEVLDKKVELQNGIKRKVEFGSVNIDSANCSWIPDKEIENSFFDIISPKSPFPILDFNFINHSDKTVLLKTIRIKVKELYSGLSGLPPEPSVLKPLTKYFISLDGDNNIYRVFDSIQVPSQSAFRFQVELHELDYQTKRPVVIEGRKVLNFSFEFSDDIIVNTPSIYLNCTDDNEGTTIMILS